MIKTVAQMLQQLLDVELPLADQSPVTHAPTIGEMYEGLSGEILSRAVPTDLDLRVVTGFVTDGTSLSGQIDRMIVRGEGERVRHTNSFVWPVQDVVATFEVKKTLTKSALLEALGQLDEVRKQFVSHLSRATDEPVREPRLAMRAFAQMTGVAAPQPLERKRLTAEHLAIYETLHFEHYAPLRIIVGLHGHQTEAGLRNAFRDLLIDNLQSGWSRPVGLPHLIMSGRYALVKANGQPYSAPLVDRRWPVILSTPVNPLLLLLEVLWTRLDQIFRVGNLWGEDLEGEGLRPLLWAVKQDAGWGYDFPPVKNSELSAVPSTFDWSPAVLGEEAFILISQLISGERVFIDAELEDWLGARGSTTLDMVQQLVSTRLVAVDAGELVLVDQSCRTAILPGGQLVAAEDNTGRLSRWLVANGHAEPDPAKTPRRRV